MKANIIVRTLLSMERKVTKWRRTSLRECCCMKIMLPYESKHCKNISTNGMHSDQMKANITMRTSPHKENGIIWRPENITVRTLLSMEHKATKWRWMSPWECHCKKTMLPYEGKCCCKNIAINERQCHNMTRLKKKKNARQINKKVTIKKKKA